MVVNALRKTHKFAKRLGITWGSIPSDRLEKAINSAKLPEDAIWKVTKLCLNSGFNIPDSIHKMSPSWDSNYHGWRCVSENEKVSFSIYPSGSIKYVVLNDQYQIVAVRIDANDSYDAVVLSPRARLAHLEYLNLVDVTRPIFYYIEAYPEGEDVSRWNDFEIYSYGVVSGKRLGYGDVFSTLFSPLTHTEFGG